MITFECSDFLFNRVVRYCTKELGGCKNRPRLSAAGTYFVDDIPTGKLQGMHGLFGYSAEKNVSWALALGAAYLYLETDPESYETAILLQVNFNESH